jgi:zinc transporter ZupT
MAHHLYQEPRKADCLRPRRKARRVRQEAPSHIPDITKFVLGLAAGSIVLLVGSLNFNQANGRSLKPFASPLFLVAMSIIYGVLFMILIALNYEYHLHHPNSYTRFQYTRNQSLGFGALVCFCISYMWLIATATR